MQSCVRPLLLSLKLKFMSCHQKSRTFLLFHNEYMAAARNYEVGRSVSVLNVVKWNFVWLNVFEEYSFFFFFFLSSYPCKMEGNKVHVKLSLCFSKAPREEDTWGSGGTSPRIFKLSNGWRRLSFALRPLYHRGNSPWYPMGWVPDPVWTRWQIEKIPPCPCRSCDP